MSRREKGGVTMLLIVVLLVFAALLGALAVRGSSGDLQQAGAQRRSRTGFYCAEAGLNAARSTLAAHYGEWNTIFSGGTPSFPYPVVGDIDGDLVNDYSVTIVDNVDEFPTNDPTHDNDLVAIMVSTCTNPNFAQGAGGRTLQQIVTYTGNAGTDYRYQAGHSSTHSGNEN